MFKKKKMPENKNKKEKRLVLHLSKERLATLGTDIAGPLDDHDILLTVGLVLKVVVDVRQRRPALHAREASRMEAPALRENIKSEKRR